ncbi:MAG: DUF5011 domain-containing protein, partial [Opitutae bacterium]|nr:DUF5011 domain-containing protein [Opitutae bacterium]
MKQKTPACDTRWSFPLPPKASGHSVEFARKVLSDFAIGLCLHVSMLVAVFVAFTISAHQIIAADFYLDDVTPNLWLDAGVGVSGTTWTDQSGNENNATSQGSPTLVEDVLNGKSVMRYSGANGEFHSFANMNNIRTVFWVLKATDGGGYSSLLGDNNQYHFHPDGSRFWSSAHTNGNVMNGALRQNGLSKTGHIDSKPSTYAVLSFLTAGNVEASNFFSDRNIGGRNFKGDLAELAIFDVALTDSQIAEIEGNLAWKYSLQDNLATDHAWKYNDPANPARATITITGDLEPPFDVAPVPVSVTFSFEGENTVVTGFDQDDVIVTGADLSNFSGSGHTYTFIVTPTAEAGQITVSIPDGSATDGTHDSFAGFMVVDYARFFSVTRMNDLVGWWSFDDDTANDKSGNDHHGVASATDIYSEETAFGRGKSINLNGDKYITVSDGGDQSTFDGGSLFSISFWTKGWPDNGWDPFISKRGEGGQGWQVRRRQNSADQIAFTLRGPGNDDWSPARNINDGQWHHLVATWGGGKRVLYVDGDQIGSENRGGNVNPTGSQLVFGGRDNSGNAGNPPQIGWQPNVWLDDIRFYRASLTAEDVGSIYNNGEGDFNDTPTLTLAGEAHLRVPVSTDFVDPGATATDTEDGDLDDISVITLGDGDTVDTSRVGDWKLFYTVEDSAGSSASVTRTIRIFDPEAPVLTLNGNAEILHEAATQYNDAGATVVDQDGNALDAGKIDVSGLPPGEVPSEDFVVTYNFKDDQDRVAETITRTVKVVDTTKPLLTIEGDEVVHHQVGAIYLDKGATATDTLDGELVVMDSLFTPNQLDLSGWLVGGRSDGLVDLDENGGILTLSPVGSTLFNDQVYFNGDASFRSALHQINRNDDFQIVVSGYFQALSAGEYEFGTEVPDDRSSFWIDLDGDGVFSTDGLKGNERTTQADARGGYSIVSLDPGFYKVAMAYSEHAGGARIDARYRSLVISDEPMEPTLWLDASNTETLSIEGGKVSIWKGAGEGQVEVTQGVDDSRPVVGPEINGRNTITFDGNDFLDGPAVLNEGDDTYTYIALWRPHRNAVQTIYEQAADGNGRRSSILHVNTHYGFNGQGNDAHNLFPVVPNEWRLTGLILNGADTQNIVIIDNGSAPKTANLNINNLNVGTDRIRVAGKATNNGEWLQGEIAELRIFDSALSSRDLTHHMKDIKERWALDNITITEPTLPPPGRDPIHPGDPAQAGQWGTGNPVNIYQEGTYTINYTATDAVGNIGTAQRTVIVEYIPGAPIITLKGDAISTHEGGTAFVDPGARLRDSQGVPLDHSQIV